MRPPRHAIDGVLLLDKPYGISSQTAVSRAKGMLGAAKAGHTGTLDPMATGLLPLAFGEATKFAQALLDADKSYFATVRLGITTATGDLEGEVLTTCAVDVDQGRIDDAIAGFRGEIEQMPPMYSALKHEGKPLYKYARAGTVVERTARRVTIRALDLQGWSGVDLQISVECSKGTYVRVLAEDIGRVLGCGATLAALRRTRVGRFAVDDAISLDALARMSVIEARASLLPVDALLAGVLSVELDDGQSQRMRLGQAVVLAHGPDVGLVRVYGPGPVFLGVAEASAGGRLLPRRLISEVPKA